MTQESTLAAADEYLGTPIADRSPADGRQSHPPAKDVSGHDRPVWVRTALSTCATVIVILLAGPRATLGAVLLFWAVLATLGLGLWLRKSGLRARWMTSGNRPPSLTPAFSASPADPLSGQTTGGA